MIQQVGMNPGRFWVTAPKQKPGSRNFSELFQAEQGKGMSTAAKTKALNEQDVYKSIWDELSQKYEVRNATIDEIGDLSGQLYEADTITLFDHAILSFDPGKSPQHKVEGSIYLTPANSDNKRDWIAEYKARVDQALKLGDTQSYNNNKHILAILEKLQR